MPSKRLLTLPFTVASLRLILLSLLRSSALNTTSTSSVLRIGRSSTAAACNAGAAANSHVAHVLMMMLFIAVPSLAERDGEMRSSLLFALLAERYAAENQRACDCHAQRQRLAEHDPRPHDTE